MYNFTEEYADKKAPLKILQKQYLKAAYFLFAYSSNT